MSGLFRGGKIPKGKQMQKLVAAQVRERVEAAVRKENEARAHAQGRGADVPSACLPMRDTGSGVCRSLCQMGGGLRGAGVRGRGRQGRSGDGMTRT